MVSLPQSDSVDVGFLMSFIFMNAAELET